MCFVDNKRFLCGWSKSTEQVTWRSPAQYQLVFQARKRRRQIMLDLPSSFL